MNDIEKQVEHFNEISQTYYKARRGKNHILFKELLWNSFLKNKDYLKINLKNVLEPMCGYAEGYDILKKHLGTNFIYEGFDYSREMVKIVKEHSPEICVYEQDILSFHSAKKFDVVILIGGLHHVAKHANEAIEVISKYINPGGYFLSFEPTYNCKFIKKIRDRIYSKNKIFDASTERAFSLDEINNLFLINGFEIVSQIFPGLLSYILYYNPDAFPGLNKGGKTIVRIIYNLEKFFFKSFIGKKLSFATMSIYKKK